MIGTRKVSYIIYLTSPDDEWTAEDGGALEIYPSVGEGTPDIVPLKTVLPLFNTMAIFNVEPGVSFHSVQEVYTDKPRMSIQGWFHGPADDHLTQAKKNATVNQLISHSSVPVAADTGVRALPDIAAPAQGHAPPLSAEDKALLSQYVNPAYLKDDASLKVREKFEEESYVLLYDFLLPGVLEELRAAAAATDAAAKIGRCRLASYTAGYSDGWTPIGPPHMRRYLRFDGAPAQERPGGGHGGEAKTGEAQATECGSLLKRLQVGLMQTPSFARLLARLTGMVCTSSRGEARRFRAGLDYTVATYGSMASHARLNTVWCLVDDVDDDAPAGGDVPTGRSEDGAQAWSGADKLTMWAEGEVGGFECYIEAEEDAVAEASDVFRMDDDDGPLLQVRAKTRSCFPTSTATKPNSPAAPIPCSHLPPPPWSSWSPWSATREMLQVLARSNTLSIVLQVCAFSTLARITSRCGDLFLVHRRRHCSCAPYLPSRSLGPSHHLPPVGGGRKSE